MESEEDSGGGGVALQEAGHRPQLVALHHVLPHHLHRCLTSKYRQECCAQIDRKADVLSRAGGAQHFTVIEVGIKQRNGKCLLLISEYKIFRDKTGMIYVVIQCSK